MTGVQIPDRAFSEYNEEKRREGDLKYGRRSLAEGKEASSGGSNPRPSILLECSHEQKTLYSELKQGTII